MASRSNNGAAENLEELQVLYQTAGHLTVQARRTETQIKEQFKKLHQFLEEEEEARLAALGEEEEQKRRVIEEKMEAMGRETAAPQLPSGALIDEAKHLGNLSFNIWSKMKAMVSSSPVTPDPNPADPVVTLTEALSNASIGGEKEGFNLGVHNWVVHIPDSRTYWELGLSTESAKSDGNPQSQLWSLKYNKDGYSSWSPIGEGERPKRKKKKLKSLSVKLDHDERKLSFILSPDDTITFTHTFTERMVPYVHWARSEDITTEGV